MADFEDANSPTWHNNVDGQINLYHAARGTLEHDEGAKHYKLNAQPATLMVRPRGWHLDEAHVLVGRKAVSASMFDFGLFFFHNAKALLAKV
jgi:malate synthase